MSLIRTCIKHLGVEVIRQDGAASNFAWLGALRSRSEAPDHVSSQLYSL